MAGVLEYKCPCCGGDIQFDSGLQKMKCPYCDTEFELETLQQFDEDYIAEDKDPSWESSNVEMNEEILDEADGLVSYQCENCGGEIVADQTMAASSCPYCGNSVIVMKKLSGELKPDLIIPFKLDQKAAQENLKNHLKGKKLLPNLFKSENRIKEIKGIYVPFWLYDCDADADISCRATRTNVRRQGDYEITETSHYLVSRGGMIGFDKVPVDGSVKMDDALMQSIEPFKYQDLVPYQNAYLAGYMANRYDQSAKDCEPIANNRVRESTVNAFMKTITGYTTCIPDHTNIRLSSGKITYALLPVWILNTKYKDKMYTFAMNGQTGKFVGNLPSDSGKIASYAAKSFAIGMILSMIITMFL